MIYRCAKGNLKSKPDFAEFLYFFHGMICPIAQSMNRYALPSEIHHAGVHDTKRNRKRWPLLINSQWNCVLVNHDAHMQRGSFGKITDLEADAREKVMKEHPDLFQRIPSIGIFNSAEEICQRLSD